MFSLMEDPFSLIKLFVQIAFTFILSVETSSDSGEVQVLIFCFVDTDVIAPFWSVIHALVWLL